MIADLRTDGLQRNFMHIVLLQIQHSRYRGSGKFADVDALEIDGRAVLVLAAEDFPAGIVQERGQMEAVGVDVELLIAGLGTGNDQFQKSVLHLVGRKYLRKLGDGPLETAGVNREFYFPENDLRAEGNGVHGVESLGVAIEIEEGCIS